MKTNRKKPFILATLALGLVLVMGLGANTFAKYIKSADKTDTARVAKFGVTITANTTNSIFANAYNNGAVAADATNDVLGAAAAIVVAPGTGDSLVYSDIVAITGTPEVDVMVTISAEITDNVVYSDGTTRPIVWKNDTTELDTSTGTATVTFYTKLEAGTDLSTADIEFPELSWAWAFEGDNEEDTILGDAGTAQVQVEYTITVEQVQTQTVIPADVIPAVAP
ncbi:MAG: hypothetical protein E7363_03130 [Clostridiales bacterium]|nr:hypothetical protein [Clostridiales bacterium]